MDNKEALELILEDIDKLEDIEVDFKVNDENEEATYLVEFVLKVGDDLETVDDLESKYSELNIHFEIKDIEKEYDEYLYRLWYLDDITIKDNNKSLVISNEVITNKFKYNMSKVKNNLSKIKLLKNFKVEVDKRSIKISF